MLTVGTQGGRRRRHPVVEAEPIGGDFQRSLGIN
jgi:hypothetical protein